MKTIIAICGVALLLLCISGGTVCAAGPWKGRILDVEIKEPLEGVVVLAVWDRVYRTPFGSNSYFYEAKETLTNKAGEFDIPLYSPINLLPIISYMHGPEFIIFKPGYGSVNMLALGDYFTGKAQEIQDYEIEGKRYRFSEGIIELPRLKTREERRKRHPSPVGDEKDWKKQRELIKAIRQEWEYLTGEPAGDLYRIKEDN